MNQNSLRTYLTLALCLAISCSTSSFAQADSHPQKSIPEYYKMILQEYRDYNGFLARASYYFQLAANKQANPTNETIQELLNSVIANIKKDKLKELVTYDEDFNGQLDAPEIQEYWNNATQTTRTSKRGFNIAYKLNDLDEDGIISHAEMVHISEDELSQNDDYKRLVSLKDILKRLNEQNTSATIKDLDKLSITIYKTIDNNSNLYIDDNEYFKFFPEEHVYKKAQKSINKLPYCRFYNVPDNPDEIIVHHVFAKHAEPTSTAIDNSGLTAQVANIYINQKFKEYPTVIILQASKPTIWNIQDTSTETNKRYIIAASTFKQIIRGDTKNAIVLPANTAQDRTGYGQCNYKTIGNRGINYYQNFYQTNFGVSTVYVHTLEKHNNAIIGEQDNVKPMKQISTEDLKSYEPENSYVTNIEGLNKIEDLGYIRKANAQDIKAWQDLMIDKHLKNIPPVNGEIPRHLLPKLIDTDLNYVVINKGFELPSFPNFDRPVNFLVNKGISLEPKHHMGSANIYDMNTGKCYGFNVKC